MATSSRRLLLVKAECRATRPSKGRTSCCLRLQARLCPSVEPCPCPRHNKEAEYKGQYHNHPGKCSEPVTNARPPRQIANVIKTIAQTVRCKVASMQNTYRLADVTRCRGLHKSSDEGRRSSIVLQSHTDNGTVRRPRRFNSLNQSIG